MPDYDLVVVARHPQPAGPPLLFEVDPIEWSGINYSNTLSAPQELSATALLKTLPDTILERLRYLHGNPTELWLYRDGKRMFAGPLRGWAIRGEQIELVAKGLLDYLKHMYVITDAVYGNTEQFTIVRRLIDRWQDLIYGHYGIDTSGSDASGVTRDIEYLQRDLNNVYNSVLELGASRGGFDIEIDPITRKLLLWYPSKGISRATGPGAVVFDERNITSANAVCSAAPEDIVTDGFAVATGPKAGDQDGDGYVWFWGWNPTLAQVYGRAAVSQNFSNINDAGLLADAMFGYMDTRYTAFINPGPDAKNVVDADITQYAVGDSVSYRPNSVLMEPGSYRIRKQGIRVDGTGNEAVTLEFT
jgi:hypothetical protein